MQKVKLIPEPGPQQEPALLNASTYIRIYTNVCIQWYSSHIYLDIVYVPKYVINAHERLKVYLDIFSRPLKILMRCYSRLRLVFPPSFRPISVFFPRGPPVVQCKLDL